MKTSASLFAKILLLTALMLGATALAASPRKVISLDGTWQVAEGNLTNAPKEFTHTVPVPGLVDMAQPPFEAPGATVSAADRNKPKLRPADPRREAFWYRRTFTVDGDVPAVAMLKLHKAMYGAQVWVNGKLAGEHLPNFTPGWFDVRALLKGGGVENELLVRVGASLAQVPPQINDGWDNEKSRYVPGICDSVELILSGTPHVVNIQAVPDPAKKSVRAVIELANAGAAAANANLEVVVREAKSGKLAGKATGRAQLAVNGKNRVEITVKLSNGHLWTPDDPFLYELAVDTGADSAKARFGLRSFYFDPKTGCAMLNGKKFFLRGSNVCIYRFYEDAVRDALPWDESWVRNLHRKFKAMHWNSLRYCIGFPPERWYEIADEEGILIQDEFPIWYSNAPNGWPTAITVNDLTAEYTEWLRERWNHPCVVLWDAQNETRNGKVTGAALMAVRDLDLSQRPWDNGWGEPQRPGDTSECHPYRSHHLKGLPNFATETGIPNNGPGTGGKTNSGRPPYLINEYGWLWINRDGSLPTLTTGVYNRILGTNATVEERRQYYARTLAAKTEFWRSKRKCAGVLHFCGLGYARPDGQTSDNFTDVKNLTYEPNFFRYIRDSFAPVGVMLDFWGCDAVAGEKRNLRVAAINDLGAKWKGDVRLRLLKGTTILAEQTKLLTIPALGEAEMFFELVLPTITADCTLEAALVKKGEPPVCSLRDVHIEPSRPNLALGRQAKASSEARNEQGFFPAQLAVDGKSDTRWSSQFGDAGWLAVDLGESKTVSGVELVWEAAFAAAYVIETSADGVEWKEVARNPQGNGGVERLKFAPVTTQWIRLRGLKRATQFGVSLWEFRVLGELPTN